MGQPIKYFTEDNKCGSNSQCHSFDTYCHVNIYGFNVYNEDYKIDNNCVIEFDTELIVNRKFHVTGDLIIKGFLNVSDLAVITVDGNIILNINGKLVVSGGMYCKLEFIENGVLYITDSGILQYNVQQYIILENDI